MMKSNVDRLQTGDNAFISSLQERFGSNLGFEIQEETKSFIAKCKSFYNAVKDAHRNQTRQNGGTYFRDHIKPVAEIVMSFPGATLWDVIVALGHDFVEDHRELSFEQALQHIETTRGPVRGPMLKKRINNLTKYDLESYMEGDIADIYSTLDLPAKDDFLRKNKQELGLVRGKKYFLNLETNGSDGDLRVKVADSVHNLFSCISLPNEKIEKTLSEKEQYLLPLVISRSMHLESYTLGSAIALVRLALLKKKMSALQGSALEQFIELIPGDLKNEVSDILRHPLF